MQIQHIKKIQEILHYGKLLNKVILPGQLLGALAGLVGILNVQRWRTHILVKLLIFTAAA
jgi:hypothetical protein